MTSTGERDFTPNLKHKRICVPELNRYVRVRVTARALQTMAKNGSYVTLRKAGLV